MAEGKRMAQQDTMTTRTNKISHLESLDEVYLSHDTLKLRVFSQWSLTKGIRSVLRNETSLIGSNRFHQDTSS